uniref:Uncharacterized protein n=1 Tax=Acrobeloides nanus TaxID=290746 RepID=A0A914EE69_9BILA
MRAFVNWGMARILSTSICYFLPNWRYASIASGLALIPLLLILIFVVPESPAWLYSKQKFEEMQISQTRISKISHGPIPEVHKDPTEKKTSYLDLWKNPKARVLVGILCLMWFTASVTSYTNDLNSTALSGDFFINQILFGVFIFASKIVSGIAPHIFRGGLKQRKA